MPKKKKNPWWKWIHKLYSIFSLSNSSNNTTLNLINYQFRTAWFFFHSYFLSATAMSHHPDRKELEIRKHRDHRQENEMNRKQQEMVQSSMLRVSPKYWPQFWKRVRRRVYSSWAKEANKSVARGEAQESPPWIWACLASKLGYKAQHRKGA